MALPGIMSRGLTPAGWAGWPWHGPYHLTAGSDAAGPTLETVFKRRRPVSGARRVRFPSPPEGGMTYANWRFGVDAISEVSSTFHFDNDPGPESDLYFQSYDASIDGTGTYHGVQTIGLAIMSRFGTTDLSQVRPAEGAYSVAGTDEGPFVSLRMRYPIGAGSYSTRLVRAEADVEGSADWYEFSVTRHGPAGTEAGVTTLIGAIRFGRRRRDRPASLADGGGSWTEFWDNNGPALHPVPLWKVRIEPPVANGETVAEGMRLHCSRMPNGVIDWDPVARQVVTTIGGETLRTGTGDKVVRLD